MKNISPHPWEYVPSNENHGAYVTSLYGPTVCDLYVMSKPDSLAVCNGGESSPVPFPDADANARLISAAPDMAEALAECCAAMRADNPADGWREIIERAEAALSKARGES